MDSAETEQTLERVGDRQGGQGASAVPKVCSATWSPAVQGTVGRSEK